MLTSHVYTGSYMVDLPTKTGVVEVGFSCSYATVVKTPAQFSVSDRNPLTFSIQAIMPHMGVSKNKGTPKWMVDNGKPY